MTETLSRRALGKVVAAGALASGAATAGQALAYVETPAAGPTNMSPAVEAAWRGYIDALETCRRFIYTRDFTDRPQIQAEANEFLMQAQAAAYGWIMAPRVDYPRFFDNTLTEPMVGTWYLSCPDFKYRSAFIDGAQTYRIWGKRGNSRFLDLQLGPSTGAEPDDVYSKLPTAPYPVDKMHLEPDGSFEIIASPDHHDGNWIQLDPNQDRMTLLSREGFYDWANESPSMLRIERVSPTPPRPIQWDEAEVIAHIEQSARFVSFVVRVFSSAIFDLVLKTTGGQMNTFAEMKLAANAGQNHAANYSFMVYDIGPDEALILEGEVPNSRYWGLQLCDRYIRTTDFTYHQSSLNGHQVRLDADGKFRMIISRRDPGVPNWLDPVDIVPLGMVYYRQYFQAVPAGLPTVRKVPFDQLRDNLPADTPRVAPAERKQQLRDRSWAMLSLYGY